MSLDLSKNAKNLLENRYLRRNEKREIIETPKELFQRVAKNIAEAEEDQEKQNYYEEEFYKLMTESKFLPNSPTLMNAGTELQQLAACFVLPVPDSMEGIFNAVKNAALIHKSGGGTGFAFSRLRPQNDVVKSTGGISSGPLSFMKVFNSATNTVKQGGKRRGANMGMLRVDHPDILNFINAKGELNEENQELYDQFETSLEETYLKPEIIDEELSNYKEKLLDKQFSNFNLSVAVTDEFMEAVQEGCNYKVVNPRNGQVVGELDAKKIFKLIVNYAWKNGEPGIIFIDEINRKNPVPNLGEIEATNPCGEQPLLPNEACNLGSINLSQFVKNQKVDWNALKDTVRLAVRFLDNVIDMNKYPLSEIEEQVMKARKIGLGVMGFHEMLIRLGISYNSEDAVEMAKKVMEFIKENAHQYSQELAEEKGAFPAWEESVYEKPQRNATLTTIAPTGSISFLAGTSGGIEPFFSFSYTHTDGEGNVSTFEYDFTEEADTDILVTTMDIEPEWHIRIQAAFQKYVDNAVSKTINLPYVASKEDVGEAYVLAHELGCKGLTVYRDGSRGSQVLETNKEDEEENQKKKDKIYPQKRPLAALGETIKYDTGCGKLYLTININQAGEPIETFLTTGSDGGCSVMTEAVSRLTSMALRSGIAPEKVIDQLRSTSTCPSFMYKKGKGNKLTGRSCSDVVGRALNEILKSNEFKDMTGEVTAVIEEEVINNHSINSNINEEIEDVTIQRPNCPECGQRLHFEQGCNSCKNCGYSSCG
ncbi:adenosylcobalamin-dependent ribonucleoside-diphosphate reductase [Selenihalanaerobacter shriftii]|uniref:Vitamin B12-dependent ribonucleotide reductase n=1 Tax=Selenihalanaerobacter shriftii TaxID=142842 RepID=A0A1T4LTP1_9FIRM|nr:adenosylcobalamin-dependent ribonucleoside-diphosphate reductase [Selenihalanaerobacter shriftii]SJZ58100.1 ribonucleoside-diphosphate reductase class II [Selenihalanaerobacter shriftii]